MTLGPRDLVLCAGTLPNVSFAERVAVASAAGFTGISLFADDYLGARKDGLSDADMRRMLSDHGLAVAELDPLLSWIPGAGLGDGANEQGRAFFGHTEDEFYAMADALGARSLNAVAVTEAPLEVAALAEAFAGLCDRAARHGLLVHLEFLPWTRIPDVTAAFEIAERAAQPNGGILLDSWHHFRSRAGDQKLRQIPAERILGVQLNDAPEQAETDPVEETLHRRLLPGEGAIDLAGIVKILDEGGCRAPIGVEVFSDALATLPAAEIARRAAGATRSILAAARPG